MRSGGARRLILAVAAIWGVGNGASAQGVWQPPPGIPEPDFDIRSVSPPAPDPWHEPVAGFYWVEPSQPGATDEGNPYGYPLRPRLTIPRPLPAGGVVILRGVYDQRHDSPRGLWAEGTAERPVFIRGTSATERPRVTRAWEVSGSHLFLENLEFADRDGFETGRLLILAPADHVVVRHCELSGNALAGGLGIGSYGEATASHIVVRGNRIHDNGGMDGGGREVNGVGVWARARHVWILENELLRNSGRGVLVAAGRWAQETTHHIYLGRNSVHHNRQGGIWVRQSVDVVVSENEVFAHRTPASESAFCMGFEHAPERIWFLFNRVRDCDYGVVGLSDNDLGSGRDSYVVGNVIQGIHRAGPTGDRTAWSSAGIMLAGGLNRFVVHNTINDVDGGVSLPSPAGQVEIVDNVISGVGEGGFHVHAEHQGLASRSALRNNLYGGSARVYWGGVQTAGLGELSLVSPSLAAGSLEGDPGFVDGPGGDLALAPDSPAVDSGTSPDAYDRFQALYGIEIRRDAAGVPRPLYAGFDIGAFESTALVLPEVSVGDVEVVEGDTGAVSALFEVSLQFAGDEPVVVDYRSNDGTATAGPDYQPVAGSLTFEPGETRLVVGVTVLGDDALEPDEWFELELEGALGGRVGRGRGRAVIVDDDRPFVSVGPASVVEGDEGSGEAVFPVWLDRAVAEPVAVGYATVGGTAAPGLDFVATAGSITVEPGVLAASLRIPVLGDRVVEDDETFAIQLSAVDRVRIAEGRATGRITDDDSFVLPVGIPAPVFGVVEFAPAAPEPWIEPVPGFYYVDPSRAEATDEGNPFGTPARPRWTIPRVLPAGSVVELRGVYDVPHQSPRGLWSEGTAAAPVFVRGANESERPRITRPWEVSGSYLVLENLEFTDRDGVDAGSLGIVAPADHVALRASELHGNANGGGIGIGSHSEETVSHVLLLRNHVHDNGDLGADFDQDVHGIAIGARASHVWVLDNELARNSGDGLQINAGRTAQATTHHVYVGRNRSHHNKQSGYWSKQAVDVVFSENEAFGHRPSNSSYGQCMGFQYAPERVWFLLNRVHDCDYGIALSSDSDMGTGTEAYLVGNVIWNIHRSLEPAPESAWTSAGILLSGGVNRFVAHNRIHDVDAGIHVPSPAGRVEVVGNVISIVGPGSQVFVEHEGLASRSTLRDNVLAEPVRVNWGGVWLTPEDLLGGGLVRGEESGVAPQGVDPEA